MDDAANFVKVTLVVVTPAPGEEDPVTLSIADGGEARLPTPPFNAIWWNASDYGDAADDPEREIIRITSIDDADVTADRAQEDTEACAKQNGKTYKLLVGITAKTLTDFEKVITVAYASSIELDFAVDGTRTIALTGNVTFTTANLAEGKSMDIRLVCDSSVRELTFPAGWKFLCNAPDEIQASKVAMLSLKCFSSADSGVVAIYAEQP